MSQLTELVDLPDPAVQPLVHPLDLPQARSAFRKSWLIEAMTSPAVGVCVAGLVWFASSSYLPPVIAGLAIIVFGHFASRYFAQEAWAYIPGKRQDRQRKLPASWQLGSGLIFAAVLTVALILVALRLNQPDVTADIREYTFGMALAAGLLVLLDQIRQPSWGLLPGRLAVLGSIFAAYLILFGSAGVFSTRNTWWGFGTMIVVAIGAGIWNLFTRRAAGSPA
jgi:hypothetical protein